jgi:hypothetical protein
MRYGAFPYQERPCPSCSNSVPSTVVYSLDGEARGVNYTVHVCGTAVNRIVGYNIANPNGNNNLFVEPVESNAVVKEVCHAAESARATGASE